MVPNEALQYQGIVQLLLYFSWKWIGLIAIDNDEGEHFLQVLEPMLSQNRICSAFTERSLSKIGMMGIDEVMQEVHNHLPVFLESKAKAKEPAVSKEALENNIGEQHDMFINIPVCH
ncbi:hypothetical protein lerEdw1_015986 [Lerista edwardsae]|nr:hypothetical protein lerEdw1_015986 [Lerista edwardsae]